MTSGVPPIDPTVTQSSSPWFFHSFNNSFTLDIPLLYPHHGAGKLTYNWSGMYNDGEWDLVNERILMEGCTGACSPELFWKYH